MLAKSSSYLPDELSWGPPTRLINSSTQTDERDVASEDNSRYEYWVKSNPQQVLVILGLDSELISTSVINEHDYHHSMTSTSSSLQPHPCEPLPLFHGCSSPQLQDCTHFETGKLFFYVYCQYIQIHIGILNLIRLFKLLIHILGSTT